MNFSLLQIVSLLIVVALMSSGQVLFKIGSQATIDYSIPRELLKIATNGWVFLAIMVYGTSTIVWVYVLRKIPLSIAYPVTSLQFILVPGLAYLVLQEPLSIKYLIGAALILAGIIVTNS